MIMILYVSHIKKGELTILTCPHYYRYRAFGLIIESEIRLPELMETASPGEAVDLKITTADWDKAPLEPDQLQASEQGSYYYRTTGGNLYFHIAKIAVYGISQGSLITVFVHPEASENQVRLYLLGTSLGALLLQRQIVPLHGSAVVIDGEAYAFIGESGAGKSTLAAAFLQAGYALLTDDVIAVSFDKQSGCPLVVPAYPQQKLWQQSLDMLQMDNAGYSPLLQDDSKYAIPVAGQFHDKPVPLKGIWELLPSANSSLSVSRTTDLSGFHLLYRHTYRQFLVAELGLTDWHFTACAGILRHTPLWQLQRPLSSAYGAAHTVEMLLRLIRKEDSLCGNPEGIQSF